MNWLGLGCHHALVARRFWLALLVVGMGNTAACHAGLHLFGEAGVAQDSPDSEAQGSSDPQDSAEGSVPANSEPYQFCPCDNATKDFLVLAEPDYRVAHLDPSPDGSAYPSGVFIGVSMGSNYDTGCGIRGTRSIACWGAYLHPYDTPPKGTFQSVSVGALFACAVDIGGSLSCWGQAPPEPPSGPLRSVSVSNSYASACAVRTNATLACWAASPEDNLVPPPGKFDSVSVGTDMACAVKFNSTLACWRRKAGPVEPPPGQFRSISVGPTDVCGIRFDDTIACFVHREMPSCDDRKDICLWSAPPQGRFLSVSAGLYSGCGIRVDNTLACWGMFSSFMLSGTFASVSAGADGGICAIGTDGSLLCWLNEHRGAGGPPGGF